MKLVLQCLAILVIAFLFLTGSALAGPQLNSSNRTGGPQGPVLDIIPSQNITSPLLDSLSPNEIFPDINLETVTRTIRIRPTETIHPVPTPKILRFDYPRPSGCIAAPAGEEDDNAGDGSGDAVPGVSPDWTESNFTKKREVSNASAANAGGSGGSFGGIGSTETRDGRVPDCLMKSKLLELLNDQNIVDYYTSPDNDLSHSASATLLGLTPGQYHSMDRLYDEDRGFIDYCYDTNPYPYWVWIDVNAEFQAMTARPRTFYTTLYVNTNGVEIPVINTVDTLSPEQMYIYTVYIPVKCEQVQNIDSMKLDFKQNP